MAMNSKTSILFLALSIIIVSSTILNLSLIQQSLAKTNKAVDYCLTIVDPSHLPITQCYDTKKECEDAKSQNSQAGNPVGKCERLSSK
jgi:hypothetical protein